ncbi:DNA primase [Roseomonas sp. BN140053]|uniref:DNA primase n=1 Tax=Roseomonas sp. BN140053 TaxID=3391898 RepID=UPI0039EB2A1E
MPLPPNFLDELRARTPLPPLVGRKVKLARNGRQWKGCCPFHNEKSPSFYVYDDHYHCFGCGAHGDALSFVMQTEGSPFREAVERLAGEAGLEVPKESPRQVEREQRARDLHDVLDAAAEAMERRLRTPEGRPALDYLLRRGLTEDTIARFRLGWSGGGRGALAADLSPLGIEPARLAEAGLTKPNERGEGWSDFFFNRVMFPIRDKRGRTVSFGGRILGDGQPKYLNGPETELFSKRRVLFGLDMAREAVFRGKATLIAVEGYMDVIALHQAGFGGAVAPLGTALTEDQLGEMWRVSPEPVLCFDGDPAGQRAAARAAEVALPLLAPDRTLRFATLTGGEDPDTLVSKGGPPAFQAVLDAARPLHEALYDILAGTAPRTTPESRAALRNELVERAGRIPDRALAAEYRKALLDRFFESSRPARNGGGNGGAFKGGGQRFGEGGGQRFGEGGRRRGFGPPPPRIERRTIDGESTRLEQARCLLAITLAHPWILEEVEEACALLELPEGGCSQLRSAMLSWHGSHGQGDRDVASHSLDSAALLNHLHAAGHGDAFAWATRGTGLPEAARADAQPAEALRGWWHFYALLRGEAALVEDRQAAERDLIASNDPAAQQRLIRLSEALAAVRRGETGLEGV